MMKSFLNVCILIKYALLFITVVFSSCNRQKYINDAGMVWNTTYSVIYEADNDLSDSIRNVMRNVELSLSPFNNASLITSINRNDSVGVDAMIREVLDASQMVNRMSNGAFDPTVSPLVNLWGFGYDNSLAEPSVDEIDSVLSFVGIKGCRIENDVMIKKTKETTFNFSAITKGFGCDEVGRMLSRNGCRNYMVEIGGEIALAGRNRNGELWHIQIDAPVESDTSVIHQQLMVIDITDCGIATSGNYRNYHNRADGKHYGHTISPLTGYPVVTSTLSATVIAPTAMLADALATACMAMEADKAIAMIEQIPDVACMLVTMDESGRWNIKKSSRFPVESTTIN